MADVSGLRTLYVNRPLLNSDEVIAWAKAQGFAKTLSGDDLHVTIAYSKAPVDWAKAKPRENEVTVVGGPRSIDALGKAKDAIVLRFESDRLDERHEQFGDIGASWDWPEYRPHLTISYEPGDIDLASIEPFPGDLVFGPERFAEVDEGWKEKATAAMDELAMDWHGTIGLRTGETERNIIAFDRASVRRYDTDGRLHLETSNISKANVCPYMGREIPNWEELGLSADRTYQLYRDPAELKKGAATFNSLPILSRHVPVTAADHKPGLVIGSTGSKADFDGIYLTNSLVFWAADAIGDIEDETKKELSSAYRYRADMTPGEVDGVRFDGRMTNIVGNHVALVETGRAGTDVVVGDSKPNQEIIMAKTVLTRKAALVHGALLASVTPLLAQDAKVDLTSVLAGVTAKNFKQKKSGIADAFKGKLAQDADIDDVVELLDKLEAIEPAEIVEEATGASATEEVAEDDTDDAMAYLKGKLSEEDFAKFCELQSAGGAADEGDDDDKKDKDKVTKPAMDAAIADAVRKATSNTMKTQQAIREAERFVRPWVGELAMAHDSAEGVYRTALSTLGVNAEGIHADALRPILEAQQKPGEVKKVIPIAQDAAGAKAFAERFPHANRLK
jgi:hypothetical protein